MCIKRNSVDGLVIINKQPKWIRVDSCIRHLVNSLSMHGYHTVASCCGHGKYPMTIVCKNRGREKNNHFELISGLDNISRKRKFYKKDSESLTTHSTSKRLAFLTSIDRP